VSCLALFQTTLSHECDPSFPDAAAGPPVAVDVGVDVVGLDVTGLAVVVLGAGLVADTEGDADFDADNVGVALVGGVSCVGVAAVRLGVGRADRAAVVCGAVSTLVPGTWLLTGDVRSDAVAGVPSFDGAGGEVAPFKDT
jgi:hypothetical protein